MADESQTDVATGQSDEEQSSSMPKDAQVIALILKDMGVTEYEPRVVNQLLEFVYRYITDVLDDAKVYSAHAGNASITKEDVKFSIRTKLDHAFTSPPPREFLVDVARQKNGVALPTLKTYSGARLPPDRYCLTSLNYRLKQHQAPQRRNVRQGSSVSTPSFSSQSNMRMPIMQQTMPSKRKWQDDYDDYDN